MRTSFFFLIRNLLLKDYEKLIIITSPKQVI